MFAQEQSAVPKDNHFLLDKTQKQKIGDTTFVVSSFLRTGQAPAFLDIVGNLAKENMQTGQSAKP